MRHDLRFRTHTTFLALVAVLALLALVATPAAMAQQRGRCASTEIPGHLVLPDGTVTEAQALVTVCFQGELVPGQGRYLIRIDGHPWGQAFGRIGRSEGSEVRGVPLLVFSPRTDNDHVRLIGVAWPDGSSMATHVLHGPGQGSGAQLADASRLLLDAAAQGDLIVDAIAPTRARK